MTTAFTLKKNNAYSTLLSTHTSGSGTIVIQSGDQSKFPSSFPFKITVWNNALNQSTGTIFRVNSASSNTFNVTVDTTESPTSVDQTFTVVGGTTFMVANEWTYGAAQEYQTAINNLENSTNSLLTDTGSANAYVLSPTPNLLAYSSGQSFSFLPSHVNTGASTLNVDGLGAKAIQFGGQALSPNFLSTFQIAQVIYDGTNFQLQNSATNSLGSASITSSFTNTTTPTIEDVGLSASVVVPGGKSIRISTQPAYVSNSAGGNTTVVYIREGSTILNQGLTDSTGIAGNAVPFSLYYEFTPTAGAHTYKISISQSGAGTMTFGSAGPTGPAILNIDMV